jgi:hypothetical protein
MTKFNSELEIRKAYAERTNDDYRLIGINVVSGIEAQMMFCVKGTVHYIPGFGYSIKEVA